MTLSQEGRDTQNSRSADLAVFLTLGDIVGQWKGRGFCIEQIPLGGTIAMTRNENDELVAGGEGCFGSNELMKFNNRRVWYEGRPSIEPQPPTGIRYAEIMRTAGYPAPLSVLYDHAKPVKFTLLNGFETEIVTTPRQLPPGEYTMGQLLNDSSATPYYASLLSKELTSDKYPNGVRLDSTQLYDKSGVFAAVTCSYIMPKIFRSLKEYSQKMGISMDEAMRKAIFVFPVGTDRQVEVANFLDLLSFYTGITFITVGANSPFEDPEAVKRGIVLDAKANLEGVGKVIEAIRYGKLSKGMTYTIADGLVIRNLVKKMRPDARGLLQPIRTPDGRYHGGTFLSYYAIPLTKLDSLKNQSCYIKPRYDPGMFYSLTPIEPEFPNIDEIKGYLDAEALEFFNAYYSQNEARKIWRERAAIKSAKFAQALEMTHRSTVTNRVELLPIGTAVWTIEGAGEGNTSAQGAEAIRYALTEQYARTGGKWQSIITVSSECGFPWVGNDYAAGLNGALKSLGMETVNGLSVPPITLEILTSMLLHRQLGDQSAYLEDHKVQLGLEPYELEKIIEWYGSSRLLPGFTDLKPKM